MKFASPALPLLVAIAILTGCASDGGLKPQSVLADGTALTGTAAIAGALPAGQGKRPFIREQSKNRFGKGVNPQAQNSFAG